MLLLSYPCSCAWFDGWVPAWWFMSGTRLVRLTAILFSPFVGYAYLEILSVSGLFGEVCCGVMKAPPGAIGLFDSDALRIFKYDSSGGDTFCELRGFTSPNRLLLLVLVRMPSCCC